MQTYAPGETRVIDGRLRVHYDGYWIKTYDVPPNTLEHKKRLIEALTRRLFNHVEHGINLPGERLEEARRAFDTEQDPAIRRVKGAMLAGALFNRATDIFTKVVEMQELGVKIELDNALLRECGEHLREALSLGKMVLHRSGEEGIDELWGEPLKAFSFPVSEFYKSRYIKMAQTMSAIDRICGAISEAVCRWDAFTGVDGLLIAFGEGARRKCETLRTDPEIFEVWPRFVVLSEQLEAFEPRLGDGCTPAMERAAAQAMHLIRAGKGLVWSMTRARVCMPKSTAQLLKRCEAVGSQIDKALAEAREESRAGVGPSTVLSTAGRPS